MKLNFIFTLMLFFTCINATIINVPANQPTIQAGIDVAVDADTVLVQPGTYIENINFNGKNITVASLFLTTEDTTFISQTIIDGNNDDTVVRFESEEDSTSFITGFKIINGYSFNTGGGIYCSNSGPRIENLLIMNNYAANFGGGICCRDGSEPILKNLEVINNIADSGGGIYCNSSSPNMTNSIVTNNSAEKGGGIYCSGSTFHWMTLENVAITHNSAEIYGGGIYITLYSDPIFINVTISNNSADDSGGGIYCGNGSSPSLEDMLISNNISEINGGGIYCNSYSSPTLNNVTISGNSTSYYGGDGGGIYCNSYSSPTLNNVIISGNSSSYFSGDGGGIYCYESSPSLQNVTIIGNSAGNYGGYGGYGGGIYCSTSSSPSLQNVTISDNISDAGGGIWIGNSNPSLINSILWSNSPEEIYINSGSVTVTYSDIQGDWEGTGNINTNPLFVDQINGDYHLTENSPCIDAGDPTYPFDPDGTIIDMGAFYFYQLIDMNDNEIEIIEYHLSNYPNPFNPETNIQFDIKENETGTLTLFNIKGQIIESHQFESGKHNYLWDASKQASGIYFYKLKTQSISETRKMLLLK